MDEKSASLNYIRNLLHYFPRSTLSLLIPTRASRFVVLANSRNEMVYLRCYHIDLRERMPKHIDVVYEILKY